MMKILTIIGARPQIIKAAALSRAIKNSFSNEIKEIIVHTGQHYDSNMSKVFFDELGIPKPDYNLNVGSGAHGKQTALMISGIEELLQKEEPDYIVLYGDTNSTIAGAIAASKMHIPVIHIEAGLRSFNRKMPEEINRVVCDHVSTLLFSPTLTGYNNLVNEGFSTQNMRPYTPDNPSIFHCGDIMYDNSLYFSKIAEEKSDILQQLGLKAGKFVLATVHRDYTTDIPENLNSVFRALIQISKKTTVVLPLHPRTRNILKSESHKNLFGEILETQDLMLIEPVSFLDMIQLESNAQLIMTDSGGVQKESYFFQKPCIIMRPETEWVEILETGAAKIVGADYQKIISAYAELTSLSNINFPQIFGDGKAAVFICETILNNT